MTRWPARIPPPPPEMPARLRCYDPADWPDPVDWAADAELVAYLTRGWTAMTDPMGWWIHANDEIPDTRQSERHMRALVTWCDEHGVDFLDVLTERVTMRRGTLGQDS